MSDTLTKFQERSREVGLLLREARSQKHLSAAKCAHLIRTSRRRYAAIEGGEVAVEFVELELLAQFLEIPLHKFWVKTSDLDDLQQVTIQILPGRTVQIVVVPQSP
jgi:transcriptional regulator with XRE-family HTH domain